MDIGALSLGNSTAVAGPEALGQNTRGDKIEEAARQFESLLMGELLRASRGHDDGWLGTGEDGTASSAMGMAEEYLAQGMTAQGGLGITQYVREHLTKTGR
jgi:Rod binding domain-containing protein